jgi:hypothetical protein
MADDTKTDGKEVLRELQGKWLMLNEEGSIDQSNSFIEFFFDREICKFKFKYYGPISTGQVELTDKGQIHLLKDDSWMSYYIVGRSINARNGKPTFLLDSEGPLGFFQKE